MTLASSSTQHMAASDAELAIQVPLSAYDRVRAVALAPDGRTVAIGFQTKPIALFVCADGTPLVELPGPFPLPPTPTQTVAFSPNGVFLAASGPSHTVVVWDMRQQRPIGQYTGHQAGLYRREHGAITALAFSPDGGTLASASTDGSLHLWDAVRCLHQRTLTQHATANTPSFRLSLTSLAFSPDGQWLACTRAEEAGQLTLWDIHTGAYHDIPLCLQTCVTRRNALSPITALAWLSTSALDEGAAHATLVIGHVNGSVAAWNVDANEAVFLYPLFSSANRSIASIVFNAREEKQALPSPTGMIASLETEPERPSGTGTTIFVQRVAIPQPGAK